MFLCNGFNPSREPTYLNSAIAFSLYHASASFQLSGTLAHSIGVGSFSPDGSLDEETLETDDESSLERCQGDPANPCRHEHPVPL